MRIYEIIDVYKEDNETFNERFEGLTIISEQIITVFKDFTVSSKWLQLRR